jgi:hypothetical protein
LKKKDDEQAIDYCEIERALEPDEIIIAFAVQVHGGDGGSRLVCAARKRFKAAPFWHQLSVWLFENAIEC